MQVGKIKNEHTVDSNLEYTCQVYPLDSIVYAEIIRIKRDLGYDGGTGANGKKLNTIVMHKAFGRSYRDSPREKDYVNARKWVMEQFDILNKHSTCVIVKPTYFVRQGWAALCDKYGWE